MFDIIFGSINCGLGLCVNTFLFKWFNKSFFLDVFGISYYLSRYYFFNDLYNSDTYLKNLLDNNPYISEFNTVNDNYTNIDENINTDINKINNFNNIMDNKAEFDQISDSNKKIENIIIPDINISDNVDTVDKSNLNLLKFKLLNYYYNNPKVNDYSYIKNGNILLYPLVINIPNRSIKNIITDDNFVFNNSKYTSLNSKVFYTKGINNITVNYNDWNITYYNCQSYTYIILGKNDINYIFTPSNLFEINYDILSTNTSYSYAINIYENLKTTSYINYNKNVYKTNTTVNKQINTISNKGSVVINDSMTINLQDIVINNKDNTLLLTNVTNGDSLAIKLSDKKDYIDINHTDKNLLSNTTVFF